MNKTSSDAIASNAHLGALGHLMASRKLLEASWVKAAAEAGVQLSFSLPDGCHARNCPAAGLWPHQQQARLW